MSGSLQLELGLIFFNQRKYFEAHEVWEDLWRETQGPLRQFYQGLIQAAVGLYHLERKNGVGGTSQLRKAVTNLKSCGSREHGLDAEDLIAQLEAILAEHDVIGWKGATRIARLK